MIFKIFGRVVCGMGLFCLFIVCFGVLFVWFVCFWGILGGFFFSSLSKSGSEVILHGIDIYKECLLSAGKKNPTFLLFIMSLLRTCRFLITRGRLKFEMM